MSWHDCEAPIAVSLSVRLHSGMKQLKKESFLNFNILLTVHLNIFISYYQPT